jgi:hypothetical protein
MGADADQLGVGPAPTDVIEDRPQRGFISEIRAPEISEERNPPCVFGAA